VATDGNLRREFSPPVGPIIEPISHFYTKCTHEIFESIILRWALGLVSILSKLVSREISLDILGKWILIDPCFHFKGAVGQNRPTWERLGSLSLSNPVIFNRGSAKPKGSASICQGFRCWSVKKIKQNNLACEITSNQAIMCAVATSCCISDVPSQWEGQNFDPPQLPHFSTDFNETQNQKRYPKYDPKCKIWLMWDDEKGVCVGRAFSVTFCVLSYFVFLLTPTGHTRRPITTVYGSKRVLPRKVGPFEDLDNKK